MTKQEKIAILADAMTTSKRITDEGREEYYHFTDAAPEELKNIYLEHYEVHDLDYEIFNQALDIVESIYSNEPKTTQEEAETEIYERDSESASIYTSDRLGYLSLHNEEEISNMMREMDGRSIAEACAQWYDNQVEQSAILINGWVNA